MRRKIVCHLLHKKYHEVGVSQMVEVSGYVQTWQCQWWCKKCGHHWRIQSKIDKLSGPDWGPPTHVTREFTSKGTFTGE